MAAPDPRPWWQDGVLGRLAHTLSGDPLETLRHLGTSEGGLGLDALLVRPTARDLSGSLAALQEASSLRLIVEIPGFTPETNAESLVDEARFWLDAGAAGISVDLASAAPPPRATVTRLYGSPDRRDDAPRDALDAVGQLAQSYDDCVLLTRRLVEPSRSLPVGPGLVVETTLARRPWRAAALGSAIESLFAALPPRAWPGCEMGAPRRGPFAVGLSMDDALRCSAAIHLGLRGTPCIDLEPDTELPQNERRRAWYRQLIDLRRAEPALHRGDYRPLRQEKSVLGFLREFEADRLAVLANLGRRSRVARLPTGFGWTVLFGVGPTPGHRLSGGELTLPGCGVVIARAGTPISRSLGGSGQRRATGP